MWTNSKEYQRAYTRKYMKRPWKKKENAARKRARYWMEKAGKVRKFDGKEVDHKRGMKAGNGKKNLRVLPKKVNRALWTKKTLRTRLARKRRGGKY